MDIELVPLATARLTLGEMLFLPETPIGTRVVAEITDTVYDGERLKARQKGAAAADWATVSATGIATIDVRTTLETEDGALLFVSYRGRGNFGDPTAPVFVAPLFDTGDPRYAWLTQLQAVAKGRLQDGALVYEMYELR